MGIFYALLGLAGFGVLAAAVVYGVKILGNKLEASAQQGTSGVNAAAKRLEQEGIFSLLFPKSSGEAGATGGPDANKNPANYGVLIKNLADAGANIYRAVKDSGATNSTQILGSGGFTSRPPSQPVRMIDGELRYETNEGPPDITKFGGGGTDVIEDPID